MSTLDYDKLLNIALEAAKLAGVEIAKTINKLKSIEIKNNEEVNMVTETDKKCEEMVLEFLKTNCDSSFMYVSEETQAEAPLTDAPTWVIDPIDGTTNFIHSFPLTAVSIGLCVNKIPVLGVIHNPVIPDETYWAIKGKGAFRSGKQIHVSGETNLKKSLISSNTPYDRSNAGLDEVFEKFRRLLQVPVHGMRCTGSAVLALANVACGNVEVYYENGLQVWDMAAGKILVEEAGGVVLDPKGTPIDIMKRRMLAANNMQIASEVAKILGAVEDEMAARKQ